MKTLAYLLVGVVTLMSSVEAATLRFEVTDSPPDAAVYDAGLGSFGFSSRISGGFSITVEPGQPADLHDFDLRLVDLTGEPIPGGPTEGTPLQSLLPVDLETQPSMHSANQFYFGDVLFAAEIPLNPWAWMQVDVNGREAVVYMAANLRPIHTIDGPHILFKPFAATIIPEPSTIALAEFGLLGVAAIRRRR